MAQWAARRRLRPERHEHVGDLDQIESAIEITCALDSMALPVTVVRAYLSEPTGER